jgi:hypothetical protein
VKMMTPESFFVGDDDHAPDYIDRGGKDTRICCQSCGRLLSEPAGIDTCRFWEEHAVITPGEAARVSSLAQAIERAAQYILAHPGPEIVDPSPEDESQMRLIEARIYARKIILAALGES